MNKFTESELKLLLKNIVIVIDTREQENSHITKYLESRKHKFIKHKLDQGDYSCYVESNEETKELIGNRNVWLDSVVVIERKNSLDELAGNLAKDRNRLEDELNRIKAKGIRLLFFIEDPNGIDNICKGNYRSQYDKKAFYGSLKSFEARYGFQTKFLSKELIGMEIYNSLYYQAREYLKGGI